VATVTLGGDSGVTGPKPIVLSPKPIVLSAKPIVLSAKFSVLSAKLNPLSTNSSLQSLSPEFFAPSHCLKLCDANESKILGTTGTPLTNICNPPPNSHFL